jgi:hypothetical protein
MLGYMYDGGIQRRRFTDCIPFTWEGGRNCVNIEDLYQSQTRKLALIAPLHQHHSGYIHRDAS